MSKTSSYNERVGVFEKAVENLHGDFGRWDVAWGEYNRYQRINGDIVQKFNDSLTSVPIGMAGGYWVHWPLLGQDMGKIPNEYMALEVTALSPLLNLVIRSRQNLCWPEDKAVILIPFIFRIR